MPTESPGRRLATYLRLVKPALPRILILVALLVIVGVPVVGKWTRRKVEAAGPDTSRGQAATLVVVTPHIEQIRLEFGLAFDRWHRRVHGSPALIDWRTPGGTTEIRKLLESQAEAAVAAGAYRITPHSTLKFKGSEKEQLPEAVIDSERADLPDVFFGGGSFEHSATKSGIVTTALVDGNPQRVRVRISAPPSPAPFTAEYLTSVYGSENRVGVERLYDDDQYWFGTALSGFGIVYNRDLLREHGIPDPTSFAELGDPRLFKRVALADPRLSGSVATLYDAILNKEGWDKGWRILREMSANARYFSSSSTQPPLDVSQGECAAGVAIDFYGRGQSQSLVPPGADPSSSRVGYIDPPGATYVDADPASIINGARHAELARRFIEFCLTDEAQALWQFTPLDQKPGNAADGFGPQHERLRRMPVKPSMYAAYLDRFTDKTNAFEIASRTPLRGWRDLIGPLMGAFAIDNQREMQEAWRVLNAARAKPDFPSPALEQMEQAFYALPEQNVAADGAPPRYIPLNETNYKEVSAFTQRWRGPEQGARAKIEYTRFFKQQYQYVIGMGWKFGIR